MSVTHHRLQSVSLVLTLMCLYASPAVTGGSMAQRLRNEVWVNPGSGGANERDLPAFFANLTLAFIGTLEDVSPEFVDEGKTELYTRLTFRPTEFLKGVSTNTPAGTVDVWAYGGTYLETPGGRIPRHPADVAEHLELGASYFVPAGRLDSLPSRELYRDSPVRSLYLLTGIDALARISKEGVTAQGGWTAVVIAKGRAASSTPGVPLDDVTAFLTALRRAARETK